MASRNPYLLKYMNVPEDKDKKKKKKKEKRQKGSGPNVFLFDGDVVAASAVTERRGVIDVIVAGICDPREMQPRKHEGTKKTRGCSFSSLRVFVAAS